jgi:hypothetical protein
MEILIPIAVVGVMIYGLFNLGAPPQKNAAVNKKRAELNIKWGWDDDGDGSIKPHPINGDIDEWNDWWFNKTRMGEDFMYHDAEENN